MLGNSMNMSKYKLSTLGLTLCSTTSVLCCDFVAILNKHVLVNLVYFIDFVIKTVIT